MRTLASRCAAAVALCAMVASAHAESAKTQTSEASMTDLLKQGFEVRSHQFYRCTSKPADDNAMSCISIVMQKGPRIAQCPIDRAHFFVAGPAMNVACVVFE